MALQKFEVLEGYAFFHHNSTGQRCKTTRAGGVVELVSQDQFDQSWKLKPLEADAPAPPNDLDLIEGVKGSKALAELFEEKGITTYRQVVELPQADLLECFKGKAEVREAAVQKLLQSAFTLAGLG